MGEGSGRASMLTSCDECPPTVSNQGGSQTRPDYLLPFSRASPDRDPFAVFSRRRRLIPVRPETRVPTSVVGAGEPVCAVVVGLLPLLPLTEP